MDNAIVTRGLTKSYGDTLALDDLDVEAGEVAPVARAPHEAPRPLAAGDQRPHDRRSDKARPSRHQHAHGRPPRVLAWGMVAIANHAARPSRQGRKLSRNDAQRMAFLPPSLRGLPRDSGRDGRVEVVDHGVPARREVHEAVPPGLVAAGHDGA